LPIYEYECEDCRKTFEVFLSVKAKPVTQCRHCNGTNIRKLVSNCSFQLKGTGWYLTDYAKKDDKAKEESNNKQNKPTSSENSKASDNKNTDKASASSNTSEKTDAGKAA
jgi:putative FmdB family regulatory protein